MPTDEENQALNDDERLRDQYLDIVGKLVTNYVLLTHSDPHALSGDALEAGATLVFAPVDESRLTIDSDLRIFLPDSDNAEINLHPLSKHCTSCYCFTHKATTAITIIHANYICFIKKFNRFFPEIID